MPNASGPWPRSPSTTLRGASTPTSTRTGGVAPRTPSCGGDLTELFVDLPEPHPSLEPARGTAASRRPASRAVSQPGWRSRVARILVSLAPFIALAAFFRTDSWLVFLLIPMIVVLARAIDD